MRNVILWEYEGGRRDWVIFSNGLDVLDIWFYFILERYGYILVFEF